ncbi:substrate-binding domain-containing protein [Prolixibacteraceae bacterium Z1-6]|uniref:Substrate-binding domain-containing protein n=1 Tax=Draconibacterium aestuarii TaxID=2998507 RepID=A0A9X3J612_9BACT|nr:substrate-binding domain-containing protein [Prolixibacteraceae bacterium Z1-6]
MASKKSAIFATLFPKPPSKDGYWNKPLKGVEKRISELGQYGVQIKSFTFNQTDSKSFVREAERILELHPDGVVLAPFFRKESLAFIEALKKLEIPFVFIDSEIKHAGQVSYIGQDSYQSGLVSGKLLDLLVQKGNILVVHFAKEMDNQNHLVQRERGFYDWYKKKENNVHQLFTTDVPDTEDPNWMNKIETKIKENNITGIFVTNSKVFHICKLLERLKMPHIKVIGHDLLKENRECLRNNLVQFLICQRPEEQGYKSVNKLFRSVVQKRQVAKKSYTSIDIVTKENVEYYKEFK